MSATYERTRELRTTSRLQFQFCIAVELGADFLLHESCASFEAASGFGLTVSGIISRSMASRFGSDQCLPSC